MSKKEKGVMDENVVNSIARALFQIHAFAKVLENEETEHPSLPSANNEWSSELLAIAQIIGEKAEFCLQAIDENRPSGNTAEVPA
jgi:hypothetical protein